MNAQVKPAVSTTTLGEVQQINDNIYSYYRDVDEHLRAADLTLQDLRRSKKERFQRYADYSWLLDAGYAAELIRVYTTKIDEILNGGVAEPDISRKAEFLPIETVAIVDGIVKLIDECADTIQHKVSRIYNQIKHRNMDNELLEELEEAYKYAEHLSHYIGKVVIVNSEDNQPVYAFTETEEYKNLLKKIQEEAEQEIEYVKRNNERDYERFLKSIDEPDEE